MLAYCCISRPLALGVYCCKWLPVLACVLLHMLAFGGELLHMLANGDVLFHMLAFGGVLLHMVDCGGE